ncbi:unnamed protein product [Heligmosomoides polygyrus]|uniref:Chorismate mutase n=1 Tax=Heligmosomoides polygyrus TaxID=6339 RepID=A0A183GQH1_HELPZ|nr:unnamed protein product [Heligmosomoides polygyrus]
MSQVAFGAVLEEQETQVNPCPTCVRRQHIRDDYRRQIDEVDRHLCELAAQSVSLQNRMEHERTIFRYKVNEAVQSGLESLRAECNFLFFAYGGAAVPSFASPPVEEFSD